MSTHADWREVRLKHAVRSNPSKSEVRGKPGDMPVSFVPMEAVHEYGGLDLSQEKPLEDVYNGYTYFRDGDVVVAKITPCFENGKGALAGGLRNGIGFGTTELHVLRATDRTDGRFLFYLTISDRFRKLGEADMYGAGGQKRVSEDFIEEYRAPIPLYETQEAIADFLDRETAKIDTLIDKKQRLLELLDEKRTALITRAVTKGLDPDVPMKDSGVQWIGEIPEHWEVVRLGRKIILQRGVDITKAEQREGNVPVISSGGVASYHDIAYRDGPGVVVGRKGTLGTVYYSDGPYWPHDTTLWVKEFRGNHPRFVYYKLRSMDLEKLDTGTANPTLNRNVVHPIPGPWPPPEEQGHIANVLDRGAAQSAKIGNSVSRAISVLREYRAALIAAAVTGKLDHRLSSGSPRPHLEMAAKPAVPGR